MGQISQVLRESNLATAARSQMQQTLAILQYFDIPNALQQEILGFQYHLMEYKITASYGATIAALPQAMQSQLALYMRIKFVSTVPMFQSMAWRGAGDRLEGAYGNVTEESFGSGFVALRLQLCRVQVSSNICIP